MSNKEQDGNDSLMISIKYLQNALNLQVYQSCYLIEFFRLQTRLPGQNSSYGSAKHQRFPSCNSEDWEVVPEARLHHRQPHL